MANDLAIYHGSQQIVEVPQFGVGKPYNDYGQGFYCTESSELAKEWACPVKNDGYCNCYELHLDDLQVMRLTHGEFNILSWLGILLTHRRFDISSPVAQGARDYILSHFLPDTSGVDVMIGYRADDSYFSFAEDFVSNTISLRDLNMAMQLGTLGEQIVLLSKRSFGHIEFTGYEVADYREYYYKRFERDQKARADYARRKKTLQQLTEDIFILDIIREGMDNDALTTPTISLRRPAHSVRCSTMPFISLVWTVVHFSTFLSNPALPKRLKAAAPNTLREKVDWSFIWRSWNERPDAACKRRPRRAMSAATPTGWAGCWHIISGTPVTASVAFWIPFHTMN